MQASIATDCQRPFRRHMEVFKQEKDKKHAVKVSDNISEIWSSMMLLSILDLQKMLVTQAGTFSLVSLPGSSRLRRSFVVRSCLNRQATQAMWKVPIYFL